MAQVVRWVLIVVLVAVCSSAAGLLLGAWQQPRDLRGEALTTPPPPASPLKRRADSGRAYGSVTDLYGNRLNPAVATYGIDASGVAVEQHFPDQKIGRLRAPEG